MSILFIVQHSKIIKAIKTENFEIIVVAIDHGGENRLNELSPWYNPQAGQGEGSSIHY